VAFLYCVEIKREIMAMSLQDDFFDDPSAFLNTHVVVQNFPSDPAGFNEGDLFYFTVHESPNAKVANKTGAKVCWMAQSTKKAPPALKAYWCPYAQNDMRHTMLGNLARYVFTPTMDGCSLGIGSYNGNGGRRVTHINSARSGTALSPNVPTTESRAQQRKMQANLLKGEHGLNVDIISPTDYQNWDLGGEINSAIKTTTWGVHDTQQDWHFFVQSYVKAGQSTYLWRGVREVF